MPAELIGRCTTLPLGSPYRDLLSNAILQLQEDQTLHMLFDRWWREMDGGGLCDAELEKGRVDVNALSMANVGGVFVVLGVGLLLSVVVAVVEFVWNDRSRPLAVDAGKVVTGEQLVVYSNLALASSN